MKSSQLKILVIGATGSIGRLVVDEAVRQGNTVRARVRNPTRAMRLPADVEVVVGNVHRAETLTPAFEGVDAVVLTVNDGQGKGASEAVYYGGIMNVLSAIGRRNVRVARMTTIGVTERLAVTTGATRAMTGSGGVSGCCVRGARPIRSFGRDGSTTKHRISIGSYFSKATVDIPARRVTASLPGNKSPRCWSEA